MRLDIGALDIADRWRYPRKVPFAHYALNTGFAYLRKGDGESAGKYFAFAILIISEKLKPFPNAAEPLAERCWTRAVIGQQLEEALKDCDQGALAQPEDSELLRNKGFVLIRMGKYQAALTLLDKSLRLYDSDAYAFLLRSVAKRELGESGWEADQKAATEIYSNVVPTFKNWGVIAK